MARTRVQGVKYGPTGRLPERGVFEYGTVTDLEELTQPVRPIAMLRDRELEELEDPGVDGRESLGLNVVCFLNCCTECPDPGTILEELNEGLEKFLEVCEKDPSVLHQPKVVYQLSELLLRVQKVSGLVDRKLLAKVWLLGRKVGLVA